MHTGYLKGTGGEGRGTHRWGNRPSQMKGEEQSPYNHSAYHCTCPAVCVSKHGMREGGRERERNGHTQVKIHTSTKLEEGHRNEFLNQVF